MAERIAAVKDRQDFNDDKLTVSMAAICDNSIGAVNRLKDTTMRDAIDKLCDGDGRASRWNDWLS